MKIAQIAPIWYSIPPAHNIGGAEVVVANLTNGLVEAGHQVTLFATANSHTSAQLVSYIPRGIGEDGLPPTREFFLLPLLHYMKSLEEIKKQKFDIIHCHFSTLADYVLFALIKDLPNTIITTHQVFPSKLKQKNRWLLMETFRSLPFVAISNSQKTKDFPKLPVVPNGIHFDSYDPAKKKRDMIFWISRIAPEKGLREAMEAAKLVKKPFHFAGGLRKEKHKPYFDSCLKDVDNKHIFYEGEVDYEHKNKLFKEAKVFLFPTRWEEPFGLVIIEAMSFGTPVVAFANGATKEIITDGVTGFLVNESKEKKHGNWLVKKTGLDGLAEALEMLYGLPEAQYQQMRDACRNTVEKNFSIPIMAKRYIELYKTRLAGNFLTNS